MQDVYIVRNKWLISLIMGKGFAPISFIHTRNFSFEAKKGNPKVLLLIDLSVNDKEDYTNLLKNKSDFKYLSFSDQDGMITKDLLTFAKSITGNEVKDLDFNLQLKFSEGEEHIELSVDLIYETELYICKKGQVPDILKK